MRIVIGEYCWSSHHFALGSESESQNGIEYRAGINKTTPGPHNEFANEVKTKSRQGIRSLPYDKDATGIEFNLDSSLR
jgi:hypothetical protein